jgi:hypothetical protein
MMVEDKGGTGEGRPEKGEGRREKGKGRRETGDGRIADFRLRISVDMALNLQSEIINLQ